MVVVAVGGQERSKGGVVGGGAPFYESHALANLMGCIMLYFTLSIAIEKQGAQGCCTLDCNHGG